MTREERIAKLSTIKVIIANPTVTYDMGMQYDILTSKGAYTDIGNVGQWPYMKFKITNSLREIQQSIMQGVQLDEKRIIDDSICKELCTYHDMWNGSYQLEGSHLSKCIEQLTNTIQEADFSGEDLFVYASVEDWNIDIRFYNSYDEMCNDAITDWDDRVYPYSKMSDEDIESYYNLAEENDWYGIPYSSYGEED